jgi:hypothetical protein
MGNEANFHYNFLSAKALDQNAFDYYWSIRQTVTVGELLSAVHANANVGAGIPGFAGPILVSQSTPFQYLV